MPTTALSSVNHSPKAAQMEQGALNYDERDRMLEESPGAPLSKDPAKSFSRLHIEIPDKYDRKLVTRRNKSPVNKNVHKTTVAKIDEEQEWDLDDEDDDDDNSVELIGKLFCDKTLKKKKHF